MIVSRGLKLLSQIIGIVGIVGIALCPLAAAGADSLAVPSPEPSSRPAQATAFSRLQARDVLIDTNAMQALDDTHKLAIGDKLSFRVMEDREEPKALTVTDSGDLEVPYLGRFPAEGKSCKQLAAELKKALQKDLYHRATVIIAVDVMARSRGKVYVVGPVRTPGPQEIPSDETLTLSKAIMRAGGFNDVADRRSVKVTRKTAKAGKQTFVVDVAQIFEKGKVELDIALEPGDLVLVPERLLRY